METLQTDAADFTCRKHKLHGLLFLTKSQVVILDFLFKTFMENQKTVGIVLQQII